MSENHLCYSFFLSIIKFSIETFILIQTDNDIRNHHKVWYAQYLYIKIQIVHLFLYSPLAVTILLSLQTYLNIFLLNLRKFQFKRKFEFIFYP